jgi:hypothetical protein
VRLEEVVLELVHLGRRGSALAVVGVRHGGARAARKPAGDGPLARFVHSARAASCVRLSGPCKKTCALHPTMHHL